jgi:predicted Zn-dependent protease
MTPPGRPARLLALAALCACAGAPPVRPTPAPPPLQAQASPPAAAPDCLPGEAGDPAVVEAACARHLQQVDDPALRLRRALALEQLGRDAEAIAELERVVAADPGQAAARGRLAERYEAVGRFGEAEIELQALAQATPGRPEGWRRLAAYYARQGLTENARAAEARAHDAEARPRRELRPLRPSGR